MTDASDAIDAAVEAGIKAAAATGRWIGPRLARIVVEAAVAAERERIAQELEKAAAGGLIFTGTGHEVELLKAGSQARAHAFRDAAAIARGSVAGKPDTQGGHSVPAVHP